MNANIRTLRIGTRASPLALAQSELVKQRLQQIYAGLEVEIVPMSTTGDRVQDRSLSELGGKGLFTKEIEEALANGSVQIAVHSMKDMPTELPRGLVIPCMLEREDVRDAFLSPVAARLEDLPQGAIIGTASLRRASQILHFRPDLKIEPLRGNVQTRLRKLAEGQCAATLLAVAGLNRLDMDDHIQQKLETSIMLPAVAQGAIGVECRSDDVNVMELLRTINHRKTEIAVTAERAMLRELDGSCRTPIAGYGEIHDNILTLDGLIAKNNGSQIHRLKMQGPATMADAKKLGSELGRKLKELAGPNFLSGEA